MRQRRHLIISSIIGAMLSLSLLLLYFILFDYENLTALVDFVITSESFVITAESFMVCACIVSAVISLLLEIISLVINIKEKHRHKRLMETVLLYSMMSNKGEKYYNEKISHLVEEEMLTAKELMKLQILHEKIANDTEDATIEEMKESIDGLLISMEQYAHH